MIRHPGIWPGKLSSEERSFRGDANIAFRVARTSNNLGRLKSRCCL